VETIDEIGQSAISELGNMIAGNAATVFASNNILIDITPPQYFLGAEYQGEQKEMFSIPFTSEAGAISVDVYIEE
jgi:chemotaxis protein CheX